MFCQGRVTSVYNSSMSWLSAVDRHERLLPHLRLIFFLLLELLLHDALERAEAKLAPGRSACRRIAYADAIISFLLSQGKEKTIDPAALMFLQQRTRSF